MRKPHLSKLASAVLGASLLAATLGMATPAAAAPGPSSGPPPPAASDKHTSFDIVRSTASEAANCLKTATAHATINSVGPVEILTVSADGLPPNTEFDLFVTQVPDAPFGVSWYQGDLESNARGHAVGRFVGRFSIETFSVAPNTAPAPAVFPGDATSNPPFAPIQMYHLGVWWNSPKDAAAAGCNGATTPFNGEHNAGVQALSTKNFKIDAGPLRAIKN